MQSDVSHLFSKKSSTSCFEIHSPTQPDSLRRLRVGPSAALILISCFLGGAPPLALESTDELSYSFLRQQYHRSGLPEYPMYPNSP
ncbi:hypothetical protein BDZ91DRAFT_750512 [Kalaharituber pfeilii]|nr:hypothetical protein BDZ91DRAFT_750512 [Kalaharituber pfeilii]